MSRLPWDPAEIGLHDADLDDVAGTLDAYAAGTDAAPAPGLAARINAALDAEPIPPAHWWQRGGLIGWQAPTRLLAAAAVVVIGVVGGLALGQFAELMQQGGTGSSPSPIVSPSPTPTTSPTPTPSPSATPTPTATPTQTPRPLPTPSDELETPDPNDVDNSGPGGGGDDNSGSGGGGGDNSGPGGGDDSP